MLDFVNILGQYAKDPDIWEFFQLDPDERENIDWDDHAVDNDSVAFYTNKQKGLELIFGQIGPKLFLNVIFLHSSLSEDGFQDYTGKLPRDMHFGQTKELIIERLGLPDLNQPAKHVALLGDILPIIVYDSMNGCKVAIDFEQNKAVLFTVSLPEEE